MRQYSKEFKKQFAKFLNILQVFPPTELKLIKLENKNLPAAGRVLFRISVLVSYTISISDIKKTHIIGAKTTNIAFIANKPNKIIRILNGISIGYVLQRYANIVRELDNNSLTNIGQTNETLENFNTERFVFGIHDPFQKNP